MTKKQAYEKYNLSLKDVNFDPNEEADSDFIKGCIVLNGIQARFINRKIEVVQEAMAADLGEEQAEYKLRMAFLMALADLIHEKHYPFWLGIAVAELFDNGCTVKAVMRAMDKVSDYIKFVEFEEDNKND